MIDTNILVAALRSKQGASYKLISELTKSWFKPAVSVPLFLEYEAVLKRPGVIPNLTAVDIDNILNYMLSRASLCQIYYLWRPCLKDPQDDMVLELAVQSQSRFIITFNIKDFRKSELFGITAITPQQFLALNRSEI
ncbi:putative toxin-antitoxin system toxin component, PIN family [Arsukibacterium ikkense]|uniref:putative toxin-antitoxin system toxin component, PIN family n=1 Tax=Arsukibacterium ikkense TaxID=336831 RepID=UPI001F1C25B5|nr:putative toxin-antitoxin system toxin component, PIN family [Arsukibacterium ikkense]